MWWWNGATSDFFDCSVGVRQGSEPAMDNAPKGSKPETFATHSGGKSDRNNTQSNSNPSHVRDQSRYDNRNPSGEPTEGQNRESNNPQNACTLPPSPRCTGPPPKTPDSENRASSGGPPSHAFQPIVCQQNQSCQTSAPAFLPYEVSLAMHGKKLTMSKCTADDLREMACMKEEDKKSPQKEAMETALQRNASVTDWQNISASACTPAATMAGQTKTSSQSAGEEEGSCIVAVRNYGETKLEFLELYFDSRKNGGGDVQSYKEDRKEKVVYVTFASPRVARRVSEKTDHTLEGRSLTVTLHKAQPTYPDRVFVTGLPDQFTRKKFNNFKEVCSKLGMKDILFGEEGTAVIVFKADYDVSTLEKVLKERLFGGSDVSTYPVAVSNTVLVRGVSQDVSKQILELYFENFRKSGGEDLQKVKKLREGTWRVSFANHQVATHVSERLHKLGGGDLQVSLCLDCLGPGGGSRDPWSFPLPPPLSMPVPDPFLLRFLRDSPSQEEALTAMLAHRHAQAKLDDVTGLTVTCTLTRKTDHGKRLAKTWTEDVQAAVRDFLDGFQVSHIKMTPTVFAEVQKEQKKFKPPKNKAVVFFDSASSTFFVVGESSVQEYTVKIIRDLEKKTEAELERNRTVTETDSSFQSYQLKFMVATGFVDKMKKSYQGLTVGIDEQTNKVVFTGISDHIKAAKAKMLKFVNSLWIDHLAISQQEETILKMKNVERCLLGRLQEKGLETVLELADGRLRVCAATDKDVKQAADVIRGAMKEVNIPLAPQSVNLLDSKKWAELMRKIDSNGHVVITVNKDRTQVLLTGVAEGMAAAEKDIRNFFKENTVYTKGIESHQIGLSGTEGRLAQVVGGQPALGATEDKSHAKFLNSKQEVHTSAEAGTHCVTQSEPELTVQPILAGIHETSYRLCNDAILRVKQGDLSALGVDAIVKAAGHQHGSLQKGGVMMKRSDNPTCKRVIYAKGPRYQDGQHGEEGELKAVIKDTLQKAHSFQLTSIAMPAISCGDLGYPVQGATQVIVLAVEEFFRDNSRSSLREVVLYDNSPGILAHFHQAARHLPPLKSEPEGDESSKDKLRDGEEACHDVFDSPGNPQTSGGAGNMKIVFGEMAKQRVDVMVNTTSSNLDLSQGAVSKSLLKAAGPELQEEVKTLHPNGLRPGQYFATTSAGRLQAQCIFHTSLPEWTKGGKQFLRELLEECVKEADSFGFSSIAFPALGTGILKYPHDVVARVFQEVTSSLLPACHFLREIRIVIFPSDQASIKAFVAMMQSNAEPKPGRTVIPTHNEHPQCWTAQSGKPSESAKSAEMTYTFPLENLRVTVKLGSILNEMVDVIVNSSNKQIDLNSGAVGQAILKACGPALEVECKDPENLRKMLLSGMVMTSCKGLPCQRILHVDENIFPSNSKDTILRCLQQAAQHASIAFPALHTGNPALTVEDTAKAFTEALKEMYDKNPHSSLTDIRVVILQPDMFETFVNSMQKQLESLFFKFIGWVSGYFFGTSEKPPAKSHSTRKHEIDSPTEQNSPQNPESDPSLKRVDTRILESNPHPTDNAVALHPLSDHDKETQRAKDIISQKFDSECLERPIVDDIIKTLTPEQCKELEKLKQRNRVEVRVDQGKGEVCLKGLPTDVMDAMTQTSKLLQNFRRKHQKTTDAEIVSSFVEWGFMDSTGSLQLFDKLTSAKIEKAYQSQNDSLIFPDANGEWQSLNFKDMEMCSLSSMSDSVRVIRKDLQQKDPSPMLPQHWAPMADHEEVKLATLSISDQEYKQTKALFEQTLGDIQVTIVKIERVQNRTLYSQYVMKRQAMEKQTTRGNPVERQLWHGTSGMAVASINRNGFNRSYCGKNAVAFGDGVCFSVGSVYSASPTYSPPDDNGLRCMYLARVLTGDFVRGVQGMKVPPAKEGPVLYDSVVNNTSDPTIFVIFNDTQAYPEFLVTFR